MTVKAIVGGSFRSILTLISPMLNTRITYRCKFKRKLDLDNPKTLNDKILWLKFNTYWKNPVVKQCADKYKVRDYIKEKGCSEILVDLLGVYYNTEDINWGELPKQFVIKLNIGCGYNIIVTNKNDIDITKINKILKKWLKSHNYYLGYSEMQYKDVEPCILIEKYICDKSGKAPADYKFYCMNGKSDMVMVCVDREDNHGAKYFYFDKEWELLPYGEDVRKEPNRVITKPINLELAFEYAEKLSEDFPFVRCDLYIVEGEIYFGELTFTPSGGMDTTISLETDIILGDQLQLEKGLKRQ